MPCGRGPRIRITRTKINGIHTEEQTMNHRVTDFVPRELVDALLPLGRLEPPWLYQTHIEGPKFQVHFRIPESQIPEFLWSTHITGGDWSTAFITSRWLAHGPKVARPPLEMCQALTEIEVRLQMADIAIPFPEIMVELPPDVANPYYAVLLGWSDDMLTAWLGSVDHNHDIHSLIRQRNDIPGWTVEDTLSTFGDDCKHDEVPARRALRVALNACLMLSGSFRPALPAEVNRDRRLGREDSERGKKARDRLAMAIQVAEFDQEITFARTERCRAEPGQPTGREMPPHWRRGHWRMQPCGPGWAERKRTLIPAVLVRADLFGGDLSDTSTTYR